jgi:hypothetical protein
MLNRKTKRRCKGCKKLFDPDPRNAWHQEYCNKPVCKKTSKAASQKKWNQKEGNQSYFRGPVNVMRVQEWRRNHPGYWNPKPEIKEPIADSSQETKIETSALPDHNLHSEENTILPLQEILTQETLDNHEVGADKACTPIGPLQDLLNAQPMILIGLIAHLTGSALQENIALTSRRLQQLGTDILNNPQGGKHDPETSYFEADTQGSRAVQLGGPASGP